MNRMYHPQSDTNRLYIPKMEGGRGLLSIADCVETEEQNLSLYLDQLEERLLRLSKSERILPEYENLLIHGKFVREKEEVRSKETWGWIRKGYLKKQRA